MCLEDRYPSLPQSTSIALQTVVRPHACSVRCVWDPDVRHSPASCGGRCRWARRHQAKRDLSEQHPLGAARRQVDSDAGDMLDDTRADFDEPVADGLELGPGQWARLRNGRAHGMHQPERRGVQHEAYLIGRRALTRGAIGRELGFVQLDQVFHLPTLAINLLVSTPICYAILATCAKVANTSLMPGA